MISVIKFFKRLKGDAPPDPLVHCMVYRTVGCAHVDGFLCDVRTCTITVDVEINPNGFKEHEKETTFLTSGAQLARRKYRDKHGNEKH